MKLEVFGEAKEVKQVVRLNIKRREYGIQIFVCDDDGRILPKGNILFINEQGVNLNNYFDSAFGLPIDKDCIKVV